jgi:hypothetical protein
MLRFVLSSTRGRDRGAPISEKLENPRDRPDVAGWLRSPRVELWPGVHGLEPKSIASAPPQDDVTVETSDGVALVHLTWNGTSESPVAVQ